MRLSYDIAQLNRDSWIGDQHHTAVSWILIIAFIACFHTVTTNGQKGDEVCETLPSEIHLIKGNLTIYIKGRKTTEKLNLKKKSPLFNINQYHLVLNLA